MSSEYREIYIYIIFLKTIKNVKVRYFPHPKESGKRNSKGAELFVSSMRGDHDLKLFLIKFIRTAKMHYNSHWREMVFRAMKTSKDGNDFRIADHFWGESNGHRWVPFRKGSEYGALIISVVFAEQAVKNSRIDGDMRHHDAQVTSLYYLSFAISHEIFFVV